MDMNVAEILSKDLRGRDYLEARGLTRKVKVADAEPPSHPDCDHCNAQEKLAAVLRILVHWEPVKRAGKKANVTRIRK